MVELERGTYSWCSCGKSQNEPFCDGSHQGTSFIPIEFTVAAKKKMALCQCQRTKKARTKKAPYCDGAHARVDQGPSIREGQ
jgi:CDGSH-type Zn-finger protein